MAKQTELTANSLKNVLWETLNEVKNGTMDAGQADSIASISREIIRTTNTQLRISSQSSRDVPADVITFSEK